MPTRVIREGILDSERVNQLTPLAELFYRRLMNVVDDFGRFSASPALLRSHCYPLRTDRIHEQEIAEWLTECESAGLLTFYTVAGKRYLEYMNFDQRTRLMRPKTPLREHEYVFSWEETVKGKTVLRHGIRDKRNDGHMTVISDVNALESTKLLPAPTNDGQMTGICPADDGLNPIPNPNPNPKGGSLSASKPNDGQMTGIPEFEPLPKPLFQREGDAMIAHAMKVIKEVKAERKNWIWDMRDDCAEVITFLKRENRSGWEAKVQEIERNPASYEKTNPKPKTTQILAAWNARIEEIRRAMNGVKD
ncbi:MAG TPA: hypothetical protein VFC07_13050 [Verrucomicrobiae bacterium]|nr:hypothetical protein [Verrucomicrobiae bacterium]